MCFIVIKVFIKTWLFDLFIATNVNFLSSEALPKSFRFGESL